MKSKNPIVHVCVVHWMSGDWIDIQLKYLKEYCPGGFQTHAFLNGVSEEHYDKFDHVRTDDIKDHATKLNILASEISLKADDRDILLFIDGDSIPVAPLMGCFEKHLARGKLIAVQRKENRGDIQPHPCFCATTVGTWKEIGGDWSPGYQWEDVNGLSTTDVGGNLLEKLNQAKIDWLPLLRTNVADSHPLWFGVYGNLVYHHGAGFRERNSRVDHSFGRRLLASVTPRPLKRLVHRFGLQDWFVRSNSSKYDRLSADIIGNIKEDFNFYKKL